MTSHNNSNFVRFLALLAIVAIVAVSAPVAKERVLKKDLDPTVGGKIGSALRDWAKALSEEKDERDRSLKQSVISNALWKHSDTLYTVSAHRNSLDGRQQITERLELTLEPDGSSWAITKEEVLDTVQLLNRWELGRCMSYSKFAFDNGGMKIDSGPGKLCETYQTSDGIKAFRFAGDDLRYVYTAPDYLDYATSYRFLQEDYSADLIFDPTLITFFCDEGTCASILTENFEGLDWSKPDTFTPFTSNDLAGASSEMREVLNETLDNMNERRKDNAFADFAPPTDPGHTYFNVFVRDDSNHSLELSYDKWDGYEYNFAVRTRRPGALLRGTVYGYFSEETLAENSPYELERRDDYTSRWHDLYKVKGDIEAALDDPEILQGDLEFGINVRQELKSLPFSIATVDLFEGPDRKPRLSVNSIALEDGSELTWVKTGAYSGRIVFPETKQPGDQVNVRMLFSSRAIYKRNHAFSSMLRGGWLPLVRFADMIDEFDIVLKSPAKYKPLGIGRKVSEKREGDVLVTHWVADSPVVFPTIIFGRYVEDSAKAIVAKKADGTDIPVTVHVDEVSMQQLSIDVNTGQNAKDAIEGLRSGARGIRTKQLRPIGEQAAAAINIFTDISGVDYPYGELNLVNDPAPFMYGQAPSSIIYLGSTVFRGEGTMAGGGLLAGNTGGGTGTAKFLKSVVAHEVGHQWWGSRVANANNRNYWFVESLAEYFSAIYLEENFGYKEYLEQVDEWRRRVVNTDQRTGVQNANTQWAGWGGGRNAALYNKGPYAFHVLRQTFGDEKFFQFLKKFTMDLTDRGEIVTRDIQDAAETALGGIDENGNPYKVDLEWFFDQWIRKPGIPQYAFKYDVRRTEDGKYLIEGTIKQRVVVGNKSQYHVVEGEFYRGVVPITVTAKKNQKYVKQIVVEAAETPFRLKVPEKPVEIALNDEGQILAQDVWTEKSW